MGALHQPLATKAKLGRGLRYSEWPLMCSDCERVSDRTRFRHVFLQVRVARDARLVDKITEISPLTDAYDISINFVYARRNWWSPRT